MCGVAGPLSGQSATPKTALLLIDIQNFYFPGGNLPLVEPEKASQNASRMLDYFRKTKQTVIHVKQNYEPGGDIHEDVEPLPGEKVIVKDYANSFKGTDLLDYLKANGIERLVIAGMQTHMCVEAATRAASDYGLKCIVISDACATRDLKYGDHLIKAEDVHYSTLASLKGFYADVMTTDEFLKPKE